MPSVIALTGATGFIGHSLTQRLRGNQWEVRALVRPASNRAGLAGLGVHWVQGDLDDVESLRRLVHGAHAVVHCAGAVRSTSAADFMRVNSGGVARLVQMAASQNPTPRFLLISSLAAREPHLSPYAASKRHGETVLAGGAGPMKWAVLRPPPVYGPGDRELRPLFEWMYLRGVAPVLGPETARFSMLYVDDLAEAVEKWLTSGSNRQYVFELHDGHPHGYSWGDLIDTVARLRGRSVHRVPVPAVFLKALAGLNTIAARVLGYPPMLTPGKVRELRHPDWVCDNTLLSKETGWVPRTGLEDGLRRTLQMR